MEKVYEYKLRNPLFRGFYEREDGSTTIYYNGKAIKGEWVEGNLFVGDDGEREILIGTKVVRISYPIITETASEYLFLDDDNGVKIFEYSIVLIDGKYKRLVVYSGEFASFCQVRQIDYNDFECVQPIGEGYDNYNHSIQVIGNIFENPELLEESNEKT